MVRRAMLLAGAALAVALLFAGPPRPSPDVGTPRARAIALHRQAIDAYAGLDLARASSFLAAALDADSTFLPAVVDASNLFAIPHPAIVPVLEGIRRSPTHPLRRCADAVLYTGQVFTPILAPASRPVTACEQLDAASRISGSHLATYRALSAEYPASISLSIHVLASLYQANDPTGITAVIESAGWPRADVRRVYGDALAAAALHLRGDHAAAMVREDYVRAAARDSQLPGLRAVAILGLSNHAGLDTAGLSPRIRAHLDSVAIEWRDEREHWPTVPDPWMRVGRRIGQTEVQIDRGDLAAALQTSVTAVALADSLGDRWARAQSRLLRGRAAIKAGELALGERLLLEARALAAKVSPSSLTWEIEHNLLHLYEGLGNDSLALAAGRAFVTLTSQAPLRAQRMMSYRDLGLFLRRKGQWEKAHQALETMVALVDSLGWWRNEYGYYAGEYFESIGQIERAAEYYRRDTVASYRSRSLEALTRLAELTGDTVAAIEHAAEADSLLHRRYPEHRPLLPGVLARAGRFDEAAAGFEDARRAVLARGQRASWGRLTSELASLELLRGRPLRAVLLGDSAARVLARMGDAEFAARARATIAVAAVVAGSPERMARLAGFRRQRRTVAAMRNPALEAELSLQEGDATALLGGPVEALARYALAQRLTDSLARAVAHDPTQASLRAAQRAPSSHALRLAVAHRSEPRAIQWWLEWSDKRKAQTLPHRISNGPRPRVGRDLALVDFVVLDSTVAALVVTDAGAGIYDLGLAPGVLVQHLDALYRRLSPRVGAALDRSRARFDTAAARRLGELLLQPLLAAIGPRRRLVIVPDGPLHLVPFDALPIGTNGTMLDRFVIAVAPALRVAGYAFDPVRSGSALVMASALDSRGLPGGRAEVEAIRGSVRTRSVRVLAGLEATEDAVRGAVFESTPGILHLAVHARPNLANPDFSEVQLNRGAVHDGRWQAFEIRGLQLDGALVVLSACETGSGKLAGGEGPLSLGRAFLQAGAGHVIVTLWPVGESAADAMGTFHRNLESGLSPADALHEAKLELKARGNSPLVWAPFTLLSGTR